MPGLLSATYNLVGAVTVTATGSGFSAAIHTAEYREGVLIVSVVNKTGSNSKLKPTWQVSPNGATAWADHTSGGSFSNATGTRVTVLSSIGPYGRLKYTMAGSAVKFSAQLMAKW